METESGKPLKFLLAAHHFPPRRVGGAELLAFRIARQLARDGHSVQVVCVEEMDHGAPNELTWSDDVYEGINVRRFFFNVALTPDPLRYSFDHPLLNEHLTSLVASYQPDLVHLFSGYLIGIAPLRAAKAFRVPTVVTLTDFWFLCPTIQLLRSDGSLCLGPEAIECARCLFDQRRTFRWMERVSPQGAERFWRFAEQQPVLGNAIKLNVRLATLSTRQRVLIDELNGADALIAVTRFLADLYIKNGVRPEKLVVKPNRLDFSQFDSAEPTPRASDETHFAYLGQIAEIKGIHILIQAFQTACRTKRSPRRMRLSLYGVMNTNQDYARKLRALAAGSPDIVFAGAYEHRTLRQLLAKVDVVVVPSLWYENAPIVILEAFMGGCPVIGTRVGGIAELVEDELNGLLFQRGDAADLARQFVRIMDEPDLLPHLRANIPTLHGFEEYMDELREVYGRVLTRAPAEVGV